MALAYRSSDKQQRKTLGNRKEGYLCEEVAK
jgi:hypothetical protein